MVRKCVPLLIRLSVKITKLSKATQETTQPISPITSQINGPAENSEYVTCLSRGLKHRIARRKSKKDLAIILFVVKAFLTHRGCQRAKWVSRAPCADSDLRSFYLTALPTLAPASCGQNTQGRACFMNILPDTNTSRFRGNFQEYSSGKVISLAQKQFLLTRALNNSYTCMK